jgi:hypothetical protein
MQKDCSQEESKVDVATDKDVLNTTLKKIREVLAYARKHRPKENGIALKDKSLSPKKIRIKTSKLDRRKRKNHFTKRVGAVADSRNAKLIVEEGEVGEKIKRAKAKSFNVGARKRSKAQIYNTATKKRRKEEVDKNGNRPNDIWVMINSVKLTYELRDILLCTFAWLTDEHIDAAQHLIKELGTGVSGLNCIATTTHCSRFAVRQDVVQTIQCHNIGGPLGNIHLYLRKSGSL